MPLTKKGEEIMINMQKQYGAEKGKSVFYASANKGTIKDVHAGKKKGKGQAVKKMFGKRKRK